MVSVGVGIVSSVWGWVVPVVVIVSSAVGWVVVVAASSVGGGDGVSSPGTEGILGWG